MVLAALVWSALEPAQVSFFDVLTIGNFWWQLGAVGLVVGLALFCGWLQGIFGWAPAEVSLEPPVHAHASDHAHH